MYFNNCIEFIKEKHKNQKRKQGTPYYLHPLAVSNILKEKGFSIEYQITGLFHDLIEDTDATLDEITRLSNAEIAKAVQLLSKQPGYIMEEYMEGIRQNHMAKMTKLADRIHNLSEARYASSKFQEEYLKETDEWFIDLAKDTVFENDLKCAINELKKEMHKQMEEER